MGHRNHGTLVLLKMRFQPLNTLCIKVVGRLIEQKHIGLTQQKTTQSHTSAFTSTQSRNQRFGRRTLQGVHSTLQFGIEFPSAALLDFLGQIALALNQRIHFIIRHRFAELHADFVVFIQQINHFLHTLLHDFQNSLVRIHLGLLLQITHTITRSPYHFAFIRFFNARDNLHQGRFTRTVQTDNTDFCSVKEGQINILQNHSIIVGKHFAHPIHGKNNFLVCHILYNLLTTKITIIYFLSEYSHTIPWDFHPPPDERP